MIAAQALLRTRAVERPPKADRLGRALLKWQRAERRFGRARGTTELAGALFFKRGWKRYINERFGARR